LVNATDVAELTLTDPSYATVVYAKLTDGAVFPLVDSEIPLQSPALGRLARPSPLVSPPTLSSLIDVRYTGEAAVPPVVNLPLTSKPAPASNFTTLPAATVSVAPEAIVVGHVTS
jgi:hypothetical protein